MDWAGVLILMLGALCVLLMLGLPVAFAFIAVNIGGAFFILGGENGLIQMTRNAASSLTSFQLAPIPLFILMGEILFHSGIAYRAIDAIERVITRLPGRMALVSVAGGTVFSALSGSTIANTAMLGSTLLPDMLKRGYHPSMAMGPIMASGAIAMLIPPSALAVLLGSLAGMSIAQLLVAGILPALILAALFTLYIISRALMDPGLAPADDPARLSLKERWRPFIRYVLPLFGIFLVVIGGLLAGLATPTESAALGCVAAVIAAAGYRSLSWIGLKKALMETVKISVMILFIIVASQTFSQILSFSGATQRPDPHHRGAGARPDHDPDRDHPDPLVPRLFHRSGLDDDGDDPDLRAPGRRRRNRSAGARRRLSADHGDRPPDPALRPPPVRHEGRGTADHRHGPDLPRRHPVRDHQAGRADPDRAVPPDRHHPAGGHAMTADAPRPRKRRAPQPDAPAEPSASSEPDPYADLDQFLPYLLNRVMGRMNQLLAERLKRHGISFQEWRVLLVLANKGPRTIRTLSEDTIIPHSTLSRMLDRMQRDGLVVREVSATDARTVTVAVTGEGAGLFKEIRHHGLAVLRQAADGLSDAEVASMRGLASRMAGSLGLADKT